MNNVVHQDQSVTVTVPDLVDFGLRHAFFSRQCDGTFGASRHRSEGHRIACSNVIREVEFNDALLIGGERSGFHHLDQNAPTTGTIILHRPMHHGRMMIQTFTDECVDIGRIVIAQDKKVVWITQRR